MNLKEYQEFTPTTALYPKEMEDAYLSAGLAAEAGEVTDLFAKFFRGDYKMKDNLISLEKELGDCLWFISQIANAYSLDLEEILDRNVDKLTSRKSRGTLQGSGDDR